MNPQYMSQQPPGQYGAPTTGPPPPGQYGPPQGQGGQPQNMYNGQNPGQRPPGPPGSYGPPPGKGPMMGAPNQGPPRPGVQNGPGGMQHPGPQGDPYAQRPAGHPGGQMQPPGQMGARGPGQQPNRSPAPPHNQMTNQMGQMNIGGPPRPGMPPSSMGGPQGMGGYSGMPPMSSSQSPMAPPASNMSPMPGPPTGFGQPGPPTMGAPPSSMSSLPNNSMGHPPNSMGAPPNSMGPPRPPQTVGYPKPSMGMPPSSMGNTQTSMGGPPTSMGAPPMGMGAPPTSMGAPPMGMGAPPTSMGAPPMGMGAPPTSMGMGAPPHMGAPPMGMGAPPTSMGAPPQMGAPPMGMGAPPTSMGAPPQMGAPPMGMGAPPQIGMPPSSMGGMGPMGIPPSSQGQMPHMQGPPGGVPMGPMGIPPPTQGQMPHMAGPPAPGGAPAPAGQIPGGTQQPRRLDPDQMPSPIQVTEDDRRNRTGAFQTGQRGVVPPLVTTDFTVEDQGNANPSFIRSTMYNVPVTGDMLKQSHLPFALSISPMARLAENESEPPIVDLGQLGPVRCNRCKAYMCPYMKFVDGGRRFQCAFCSCNTEVPPEYFAHLDHTGRRVDTFDRPELCLGAYEFYATEDYCKNNKPPKPPAFIFMIDVSYNAVKTGMVHLICNRLKDEILVNLPKEAGMDASEIRVGFVTYAKELHFYNVKGALAQPQMLVVSDVQDVFVPLLDGFLVTLAESDSVIESLMAQIPMMFADSRETEVVLGPVIQAGLDALKSAERSGKLFIFHSSLPTAEAPGKLKNRDDRKLLGTEKEKTILTPQGNFYTKLGVDCVAAGCCVDMFLFPNSYIDVASVGEVSRLTGGSLYKYTYFQADLDGNRFMKDLNRAVEKPIAFDAIMRVRTSEGIRPVDFLGNFYMSNTVDVELAAVDCDKAIGLEIKHDDKLSEADGAYLQVALLYTSVSGQRRLRILNMSYNCCSQMADLFRNCELDTLVNFMAKQAIRGSLNSNPKKVRENIMNQCSQILACYRKNCASPSSAGQLILPECMKLLPVYSNCIIKSGVLQGGSDISTDDRNYVMHLVNEMSVKDTNVYFYPRLLPLRELEPKSPRYPTPIRCSYERLKDTGVYLIDNGLVMFIWVGINTSVDWLQDVFGVQSAAQIDIDKTILADLDNELSRKVRALVSETRNARHRHIKLAIVRQRDKLEPVFQQYLVEDRGSSGNSYVDFLCHIHKEIRSLLS